MTIIEAIKRAQQTAPVDVYGLAAALGVRVRHPHLAGDVSGELVRVGEDRYDIHVNASHAPTRQRFTIAHELGHYIYHRELIGEGIRDDRAYRSTRSDTYFNSRIGSAEETEANRFAATLLMPWHLIKELQEQELSRPEMAQRLGVSEHALAIRLGENYP